MPLQAQTGGGKLATISKKTWIKAFLALEEDVEIVAVLTSLGNDHHCPTLAWYIHINHQNEF